MAVAKDQIRQIITENNITSVADVYSLLKDSFKDILQELLEAEMDATLGDEFSKLIRASRAMQLSSRALSTADEMDGTANSIRG